MSGEVKALRKDAARWQWLMFHWKNVQLDWTKEGAPKSIRVSVQAPNLGAYGRDIERWVDDAMQVHPLPPELVLAVAKAAERSTESQSVSQLPPENKESGTDHDALLGQDWRMPE